MRSEESVRGWDSHGVSLIFPPIFSVFSQVFLTLLFLGLISKRNECKFRT